MIKTLFASGAVAAMLVAAPIAASAASLKEIAGFPHQVTGISVAANGRIFVNFPRWTDDAPVSVAELLPNGSLKPYPDKSWNSWRNARANEMSLGDHFVCVQSVVADTHGALWVLDPGAPGNEKILPGAPKLVHIDLATNKVTKVIKCQVAEHCWDPVRLAIVEYAPRFKRVDQAAPPLIRGSSGQCRPGPPRK